MLHSKAAETTKAQKNRHNNQSQKQKRIEKKNCYYVSFEQLQDRYLIDSKWWIDD